MFSKKHLSAFFIILPLLIVSGCSQEGFFEESVHKRIHSAYYDPESYSASCSVCAYTKGGESKYECSVDYDKDQNLYTVVSEDMKLSIGENSTVISRGENIYEAPSSPEDMYLFVNTFFKSYYESESVSTSVSKEKENKTTLLECDVINPTSNSAHMKLWIDTETVLPVKMQVFDSDEFMHTEIIFNEFKFKKSGE